MYKKNCLQPILLLSFYFHPLFPSLQLMFSLITLYTLFPVSANVSLPIFTSEVVFSLDLGILETCSYPGNSRFRDGVLQGPWKFSNLWLTK